MTEERHSKLQSVAPRQTLSPEQAARQAAENGFRQFDLLADEIRKGIAEYDAGKFELRPSTLMDLDRVAVDGMVDGPGHLRRGPITIGGGSKHVPPDANLVPRLVEDMCAYVNANWWRPPVHLAAYVMWRLNWIHPFEDGNGRTSRAASYLVLCVRLRRELPGVPTIPELISYDKQPYYIALDAADAADKEGRIDVSVMEDLLTELLKKQIEGAARGTDSRRTRSATPVPVRETASTSTSDRPPAKPEPQPKRDWTALIITVVVALVTALATMLATADGQRFLGCGGPDAAGSPSTAPSANPPDKK